MSEAKHNSVHNCDDPADQAAADASDWRSHLVSIAWQAPTGVTAGTWDYMNRAHIGDRYDTFLKDEPLNTIDRKIISHYLPALKSTNSGTTGSNSKRSPPLVIDFGSGTGRTLLPLIRDGYRGLAVDLSGPMLRNLQEKMLGELGPNGPISTIQANLVNLRCIADNSVDHGVCMLSTLGMICGAANRAKFLEHAHRIIKPNGLFFVHAHNYFFQWRHPGGIKWAATNVWASLWDRAEIGDRLASYRQVSDMFIHHFRRRELTRALNAAGFSSIEWFGVEARTKVPVHIDRWTHPFRFVGWIAVATHQD